MASGKYIEHGKGLGFQCGEGKHYAGSERMTQTSLTMSEIVRDVSKSLMKDQARKQRIFQRSPNVFSAMDAEALATASARELATRELKDLGIDCGDGDPVQLLDMHHAGRAYARDQQIPGNRLAGGNKVAIPGEKLLGEGMDSAGDYIDRYLQGRTDHAQDARERIAAKFLDASGGTHVDRYLQGSMDDASSGARSIVDKYLGY